ncbi:MAG: cysteine--tRNA ligase [Gammaproteobacteria bacterium]|nr:cysteine--tRNA ligase [Gammaproteobacteria bacterium]
MRLFNSLSGKKEELVLSSNRKISIYVCGMTVYDDCHIGHARTFLSFDMVVRYLRFKEIKVNYIRNITDVDDKILARANENKEEPNILTTRYIERMTSDFNALGMIAPDKEPKATENIGIIIDLISKLIESGNAYHKGGDVYFSIDSFSDYGKLSNQKMDEILLGNRIEINENKKNPADFVLWKKEDQGLLWDSPWGKGRPGWHIECSAMSMDSLGETFDIHAGGADLKFPHHENEIAQSESATGKKFANYWMHTGPLRIDKEKMSKSLDNFVTIREALKGYSPEIVRYFLLSSHYRSPINYSESGLKESKAALDRLYNSINGLDFHMQEINLHSSHFKKFVKAMDDDFNAPEALAVLFDLAKVINKNKEDGNEDEASLLAGELIAMSEPLGLLQQDPQSFLKSGVNMDELEINKLIKEREEAREGKDYSKSDKIRDYLFEQNIILEDSKEGTFWRRR